jgi:hypothetical protein
MKTARMVVLCVATGVAASAQSSDDATIERHGDHAAIAAYTGRPLDAAATALGVGYEDPLYMFRGDMMDISAEVPRLKPDTLVPKRQKLEVEYLVDANGAPRDFGDLLQRIADQANAQSGFAYRVDRDADGYYFFVATRTHDAQGRAIEVTPLLDRPVDIPPGYRAIRESAELMANELSKQTGRQVSCCQGAVAGIPWGMETISFEAHHEAARSVLKRLGLHRWHMRCDMEFCAIDQR